MTKEEGNKLIAEFMGARFVKNVVKFENFDCLCIEMKYHTSLDWLMPVVEKIATCGKEYFFTTITVEENGTFCSVESLTLEISAANSQTTIEAVWQAVTQFLLWYNNNKQ